jgi:hypothetical protein
MILLCVKAGLSAIAPECFEEFLAESRMDT